jgi:hypothetical protein
MGKSGRTEPDLFGASAALRREIASLVKSPKPPTPKAFSEKARNRPGTVQATVPNLSSVNRQSTQAAGSDRPFPARPLFCCPCFEVLHLAHLSPSEHRKESCSTDSKFSDTQPSHVDSASQCANVSCGCPPLPLTTLLLDFLLSFSSHITF